MLKISPLITIPEEELRFEFIRASGPGGQNVNKVASAVQLRFDVQNSPSLSEEIKQRLIRMARKRVTEGGLLVIESKRFRSQERNREDALQRLAHLIQLASQEPKPRHRTQPSQASREARLAAKKRRGELKRMRRNLQDMQ